MVKPFDGGRPYPEKFLGPPRKEIAHEAPVCAQCYRLLEISPLADVRAFRLAELQRAAAATVVAVKPRPTTAPPKPKKRPKLETPQGKDTIKRHRRKKLIGKETEAVLDFERMEISNLPEDFGTVVIPE